MDCGNSESGITDKIRCFEFQLLSVEVKLELDNFSGQITGLQEFRDTGLLVDELSPFFLLILF